MNVLEILTCAALLLWTAGGAYVVLVARRWDCVMEAPDGRDRGGGQG